MIHEKQSMKYIRTACTSRRMLLEIREFEQVDTIMASLENLANSGNAIFFSFSPAGRMMAFIKASAAAKPDQK